MRHAQRFLSSHGAISNLFRLCRHGVKAAHYRILRGRAFDEWQQVTCARLRTKPARLSPLDLSVLGRTS